MTRILGQIRFCFITLVAMSNNVQKGKGKIINLADIDMGHYYVWNFDTLKSGGLSVIEVRMHLKPQTGESLTFSGHSKCSEGFFIRVKS